MMIFINVPMAFPQQLQRLVTTLRLLRLGVHEQKSQLFVWL